jgi:hypothetical protein
MRSFGAVHWIEQVTMEGDLSATNTFENPDRVKPVSRDIPPEELTMPKMVLSPKSFNCMRFKV